MTRPPIFDSTADAAEFLAQHSSLGHYLIVCQYGRFVQFMHETSDGDIGLPALLLQFLGIRLRRDDLVSVVYSTELNSTDEFSHLKEDRPPWDFGPKAA